MKNKNTMIYPSTLNIKSCFEVLELMWSNWKYLGNLQMVLPRTKTSTPRGHCPCRHKKIYARTFTALLTVIGEQTQDWTGLGCNPGTDTHQVCEFGQVTSLSVL